MNDVLPDADADFFVTSGIVPVDSPSYVERPADEQTLRALSRGQLCLILAPRQSGKSSLMVHTQARLRREAGAAVAIVDLQSLGSEKEIEGWFRGVIDRLLDREELDLETDARKWWREHAEVSPTARFIMFLEEVVLAQHKGRVVIFFDEIDTLLRAPFGDDVFTTFREFVNKSRRRPDLARLAFALVGVADPVKLVRDPSRTSVNVGEAIALEDFDRGALGAFRRVFGPGSEPLFERIYHWTAGQPFLVQTLAAAMHALPPPERTTERLDAEVKRRFLDRDVDKELHLVGIKNVVVADAEQVRPALRLYERVLANRPVAEDRDSPAQNRLRLAGLVAARDGRLVPRNEIYRRVFTQRWVRSMIGVDRTRQIVAAAVGATALMALVTAGLALRPRLFPAFVHYPQAVAAATAEASATLTLFAHDADRVVVAGQTMKVGQTGVVELPFSGLHEGRNYFQVQLAGGLPTRELTRDQVIDYYPRWLVGEMPDAHLRKVGYVPARTRGTWDFVNPADGQRAPLKDARWPLTAAPIRVDLVSPVDETTRVRRGIKPVTSFVVSAHADGRLRLWRLDYDGLTVRASLPLATAPLRALALGLGLQFFTADARGAVSAIDPVLPMVAVAGYDAAQAPDKGAGSKAELGPPDRLLEMVARRIVPGSSPVAALAASGDRLAIAGEGGVVRLFKLQQVSSDLRAERVSSMLAALEAGRATLQPDWPLPRATLERQLSIDSHAAVTDLALSRDGSRLAAADASGRLGLWDAATGERLASWSLGERVTARLAFLPGGREDAVLAATDTGEVKIFFNAPGVAPRVLGRVQGRPLSAAFTPDGQVAFVGAEDAEPGAWVIAPPAVPGAGPGFRELQVFAGHGGEVRALALLPGDRLVSSGDYDGTLRFWDLRSGRLLRKIVAHPEGAMGVAVSPDGKLVASAGLDHTVRLWDAASGAKLAVLRAHTDRVFGVAFSPDGRYLASNGVDGAIILWDVASRAVRRQLMTGGAGSDAVVFSSRGDRLFAGVGNDVQEWDPASGTKIATYAGHSDDVKGIALSSDGREMVTGATDNTARVWDLATGRAVATLNHPKEVWGVAYSPDGQLFATGGYDGEIRIYDRAKRAVVRRFKVDDSVQPVVFSKDGRVLITGSMDGSIRQWLVGDAPPSYLEKP